MLEAVMHLLKYQVEKMEFNINEEFQNNKCKKIVTTYCKRSVIMLYYAM
jgi:hypothetical protein